MSLSVVISYCSMERPFLDTLLSECKKASNDVIVCVGTHMYDGTPEPTFPHEVALHHNAKVLQYPVDVNLPPSKREGVVHRPTSYFHNLARWTGIQVAKHPFVLLLDADEIPDGTALASWIDKVLSRSSNGIVMKMANFWYFKRPTLRAYSLEDSVVIAHKDVLQKKNVFGDAERDHIVNSAGRENVLRMVKHHISDAPMFHHFSYVRKDIMSKLSRWAHRDDVFSDVAALSHFEHLFDAIGSASMVEPIHGYQLHWVEDTFGLESSLA